MKKKLQEEGECGREQGIEYEKVQKEKKKNVLAKRVNKTEK